MNKVFIPTPVSEKPPKEGYYAYINKIGYYHQAYWIGDQWRYYKNVPEPIVDDEVDFWLKPIEVSGDSPVNKIYEKLDELMPGKADSHNALLLLKEIKLFAKNLTLEDLARSAHIQNLESQVAQLKAESDTMKGYIGRLEKIIESNH